MNIGIDKISFFTPPTYIEMVELAEARAVDPNKYLIGIGQEKMSIAKENYDVVAMAANAANKILTTKDKEEIDLVLFATETGVDFSKAGATWVHDLVGIQPYARSVELKQACYSATAGIQLGMGHIALHPESKVLILASDIAKYGVNTGGEPTQGAGAVAMLLSANPSILAIETESAAYTQDIDDFWRPTYSEFPYVDGKYSNEAYLGTLTASWHRYKEQQKAEFSDFEAMLFHVPYTKMGRKALQALQGEMDEETNNRFTAYYESAIKYNNIVGNIYTGSLYLSLISLLEQADELKAGARIGMFSYGSGAVGEFFVGEIQENYKDHLMKEAHEKLLNDRKKLSIAEYEDILSKPIQIDEDGNASIDTKNTSPDEFVFVGVDGHRRQYQKIGNTNK